jgi:3-dehydroquinate dehydratase/shikimate dehydrogenase
VTVSESQPLLCDVIAAPTMAELRARRAAVENAGPAGGGGADLIELRLDTVDRPDVAGALQGRRRPVLVTCRATWEGGHFKGSEEERQRILREALETGAEYVDIEWKAQGVDRWLRPEDRPRVVLSFHDFERMPADLAGVVREMRATGAGVVKVAARAKALRDLLPLLEAGRAHAASGGEASAAASASASVGAAAAAGQRTVLIAMGMSGVASRILAAHFRSCWTYAGPAVAPGQIEASRLLDEFRFRSITPHTQVYAVVGQPITHSISPAMHNAAFAAEGIDAVYIPCEAADIDDFFVLAEALPIVGASVTAPFKLDAYERSEAMDDDVKQVGAANTLRRKANGSGNGSANGSGWESRNTDVAGFMAPLPSRLTLRGARAAILGTGGAARAVAVGLGAAGAIVTVHARNTANGTEVAALANGSVRAWGGPGDSLGLDGGAAQGDGEHWDLLVNTTPIGTFPAVTDTPIEALTRVPAGQLKGRVAYDLVYNPRPTRLLRDAAAAGCATLDGLDMLVEQAARQFEWWTGRKPSTEVMREAAERRLAEMAAEDTAHERANEGAATQR